MLKRVLFFLLAAVSGAALAAGSTVNPNVPAPNSLVSSAPIRANFAAAQTDINNLFGQNNGGSAPVAALLGELWLNTSATPYILEEYDGANWVVVGDLNATTHAWTTPLSTIPLGTSVNNPGTGVLESLLPVQNVTQTSRVFVTADLFKKTRRSNSGAAMTDTLPASTATGLINGAQINIANVDTTAIDTVMAGAGTTILGNSTLVIQPGRDIWLTYDLANTTWRGVANTSNSVLFTGTPPTATQLWGGSSVPGGAGAVAIGPCLSLASGTLSDSCDGTVTSVSVASANGMGGSVSTATTTPTITLTTSVNGLAKGNGTGFSAAVSGTDYAPATSGTSILKASSGGFANAVAGTDYPATGVVTAAGPTGSATVAPVVTVNANGQVTALSSATITPAVGNITGLGTGVATALGVNIGTAGAPVVNGGALGTPSSGVATNLIGTASGLTAGTATAANSLNAAATISGSTSLPGVVIKNAVEPAYIIAAAPSATINFNFAYGAIQHYTTNAANNFVINFAWSSGTSFATMAAATAGVGTTVTGVLKITQGVTAYYATSIQVDGTTTGVTTRWQGGTAPSAGNASSEDDYVCTIEQTAATPTYTVDCSLTQFK